MKLCPLHDTVRLCEEDGCEHWTGKECGLLAPGWFPMRPDMNAFVSRLRRNQGLVYEMLLILGVAGDGTVSVSEIPDIVPDLRRTLEELQSMGLISVDGDVVDIENFVEIVFGSIVPRTVKGSVELVKTGHVPDH